MHIRNRKRREDACPKNFLRWLVSEIRTKTTKIVVSKLNLSGHKARSWMERSAMLDVVAELSVRCALMELLIWVSSFLVDGTV